MQLLREEEIRAIYQQGEDATIVFAMGLEEVIKDLAERVQKLEDQIAKNSSNSGKPPSSDGLARKPKNLRHKSGKQSGGQKGHAGSTLTMVDQPDHIEVHDVKTCCGCEETLV